MIKDKVQAENELVLPNLKQGEELIGFFCNLHAIIALAPFDWSNCIFRHKNFRGRGQ